MKLRYSHEKKWGKNMDLMLLAKLAMRGESLFDVLAADADGWEELRQKEDEFVERSLEENPKLAKIYAELVRGDITFDEFVIKKRKLDDEKYQAYKRNTKNDKFIIK
jgi:hypothetical protein